MTMYTCCDENDKQNPESGNVLYFSLLKPKPDHIKRSWYYSTIAMGIFVISLCNLREV